MIVEGFEWRSADAIAKVRKTPAVQALWAEFGAACDYRLLSGLLGSSYAGGHHKAASFVGLCTGSCIHDPEHIDFANSSLSATGVDMLGVPERHPGLAVARFLKGDSHDIHAALRLETDSI